MKKLVLVLASAIVAVGVMAQGTDTGGLVNFVTKSGSKINIKAVDSTGAALGDTYMGGLFVGAAADSLAPAVSAGAPVQALFDGGYIYDKAYKLDGVAQGASYFFAIAAWDKQYANYQAAKDAGGSVGMSTAFARTTGGNDLTPPGTATRLESVQTFAVSTGVIIPEPSVLALGFLGMGAFLLRRRS